MEGAQNNSDLIRSDNEYYAGGDGRVHVTECGMDADSKLKNLDDVGMEDADNVPVSTWQPSGTDTDSLPSVSNSDS